MPEFKYIMFAVPFGTGERLVPVLFPEELTHSLVADALKAMPDLHGGAPETAGTVLLHVEVTYGHSESLGLPSTPLDAMIMNSYNYTHGLVPPDEDKPKGRR